MPASQAQKKKQEAKTRQHHRVKVPLHLTIDGKPYHSVDWSLGGFQVQGYEGDTKADDERECGLILPFDGFVVQVQARFRVVWRRHNKLGCSFIELDDTVRRALRYLVEAAIEGRRADASDVLASMTAPIPTNRLEDLLKDEDETHVYVGAKRLLRKTVIYVAAVMAVLFLFGALIHRNMQYIDIPAGTIVGNFVSVAPRVEGRLTKVWVDEGQIVKAGQPLFNLVNGELQQTAEIARAAVQAAQARYDACLRQIAEEEERFGFYRQVTLRQQKEAQAKLAQVEARLAQTRRERERQDLLNQDGLIAHKLLEIAIQRERVVEQELIAAREQVEIATLNVNAAAEGRFFGGQEIEGQLTELRQQSLVLRAELRQARQSLAATTTQLAESSVAAPVDGLLYTLYRRQGEVVGERDVVASIRVSDGYAAVGTLPREEAVDVRPGLVAQVVIPKLRDAARRHRHGCRSPGPQHCFAEFDGHGEFAQQRPNQGATTGRPTETATWDSSPYSDSERGGPLRMAEPRATRRDVAFRPIQSVGTMILNARRRPSPGEGFRQALPSTFFYVGLIVLILVLLPEPAWEIRPDYLFVLGILGIWRYSWMLLHIGRAFWYQVVWYPRIRRLVRKLPPEKAFPGHLYFLIPTYKEVPWISQHMIHSVLRETAGLPSKVTLIVVCAEGEDVLFRRTLQDHPRGDEVTLEIMNQRDGKRMGMSQALRALADKNRQEEDSVIIFMDGDSVLGPYVLWKCLPLFKLFPKLGAVTTDELPVVEGSRWYKQWYELRFAQRHRLMRSMSLSRHVLTLTGRFSMFRTRLAIEKEFIDYLEDDHLDHALHGRFRFLTGDDKSTWFCLLKHGWEMLYVPDALVFCLETADENPFRQSVAKMHRWFGNMLRNNGRAVGLGPKPMGFFTWWSLVDQRLSMWTTLVGPIGAILLAIFRSPYYLVFYLLCALLFRLLYLLSLATEGMRLSFFHLWQLIYTQWMGSLVKIWVSFRLDQQTWGKARGGISLKGNQDTPAWLKWSLPHFQTFASAFVFVAWVALVVGVLKLPSESVDLLATRTHHALAFIPATLESETIVRPEQFGGFPNDNKPDDHAIQQAIDSLPPKGRGIVTLSRGHWLLDGPIRVTRPETWLFGRGAGKTVLAARFGVERGESIILVKGAGRIRSAGRSLSTNLAAGERRHSASDKPIETKRDGFLWLGAPNDETFLAELGTRRWNKEFPWIRQYLAPVAAVEGRTVTLSTSPGFELPAGSRVEPVDLVWGIVLQGFSVRHTPPGAHAESVRLRYENLFPRYAVDAISFEWAAYSGARDLDIEMAGRHPVNVENSYSIAMERLHIDGAWNKGDGGAGYVRFARSYHSALISSTVRNMSVISPSSGAPLTTSCEIAELRLT